MIIFILLAGILWAQESQLLNDSQRLLLGIEISPSQYRILKESDSSFVLLKDGTELNTISLDKAKSIWNNTHSPIAKEEFKFSLWLKENGQWPTGGSYGFHTKLVSAKGADFSHGYFLEHSSKTKNFFWEVGLRTENHISPLNSNYTNDPNSSYSEWEYKLGVGIQNLRFRLLSHQSPIPQFLYLEDSTNIFLKNERGDLIHSFETNRDRAGNWMGHLEAKLGFFRVGLWRDAETFSESILQIKLDEMPFPRGHWGMGITSANGRHIPGLWNKIRLIRIYDNTIYKKPSQIDLNAYWEIWYLNSSHYDFRFNLSLGWNDIWKTIK